MSDSAIALLVASTPTAYSASGTLDLAVAPLVVRTPVVFSGSGTLDTAVAQLVTRVATVLSLSGYRLWNIVPTVIGGDGVVVQAHSQFIAEGSETAYALLPEDGYTASRARYWPLDSAILTPARSNYALNPRAHVDVAEWEDESWPGPTRVTSVPGVSLPSGADAAFYSGIADGGATLETDLQELPFGVAPGDTMAVQIEAFVVGAVDEEAWFDLSLGFDQGGYVNVVHEESLPLADFVRYTGAFVVPENATAFSVYVTCNQILEGGADTAAVYLTKVMVEVADTVGVYADGDSEGWQWSGTEHASISRVT